MAEEVPGHQQSTAVVPLSKAPNPQMLELCDELATCAAGIGSSTSTASPQGTKHLRKERKKQNDPCERQEETYFCLSLVSLLLLRLVLGIEWTEELFLLEECDECEE